ncbi:hypothetical protein GUITHDRAFT_114805 [Guillardia theta CCMP2712]|uniref:Uncharacterized protein n=1 Tax=Guillardia theta (strain CCMP2712) TaxID=905079 RepID=L1IS99_GUITC|nr:hypothetical protein GUITHDRAFT_114805 [Guillardia theta CCMP2712]EKX39146.1 hypothetical protein GUITHDRAFT_114805 [Guillardia theta CCMP2712]|eukprot:XP_005826126.1 hypothetical protein GUITHDRAFT_114805 [Guillardia theta CCMP2712]
MFQVAVCHVMVYVLTEVADQVPRSSRRSCETWGVKSGHPSCLFKDQVGSLLPQPSEFRQVDHDELGGRGSMSHRGPDSPQETACPRGEEEHAKQREQGTESVVVKKEDNIQKRLNKQYQRMRTKELHQRLDALVPVRQRPDGGKLGSRRTVLQLLEDLQVHMKSILCSPTLPSGYDSSREPLKQGDELGEVEMKEGLLSCSSCPMAVVSMRDMQIVAMSSKLQRQLCLPSLPSPIGQYLQTFILPGDAHVMAEFERQLRMEGGAQACLRFLLTSSSGMNAEYLDVEGNEAGGFAFLFFRRHPAQEGEEPVSSQWDKQTMMRLSGIFEMDELSSSCFPWEVEESFIRCFGTGSALMDAALARLLAQEGVREGIQLYVKEEGGSEGRAMMKMLQLHLVLDFNHEQIPCAFAHLRMRLPPRVGELQTEWEEAFRIKLDGTPYPHPSHAGTWMGYVAHGGWEEEGVRVTEVRMKRVSVYLLQSFRSRMQVYSTASMTVTRRGCCYSGQVVDLSEAVSGAGERKRKEFLLFARRMAPPDLELLHLLSQKEEG